MPIAYEAVFNPEWVKYGIEGVIFLVGMAIIFLLYFMTKKGNETFRDEVKRHQKEQDEAMAERQKAQDERARQQDKRFAETLEAMIKSQTHVHTPEEENATSKFTGFVHLELERLVKKIKCSRAYFVIYHNGAWSNNGISLPKMSMMNEAIGEFGIESLMPQLQSIPRGFLPGLDGLFEKEGKVFFRDIERMREKDPITYNWLTLHGCRSVAIFPVTDVCKDYNIGFVVAEYYGEIPSDVIDKTIKIATSKTAEGIAAAACFTNEDEKLASGENAKRQ